jgi:hypothetical protein
MGKKHLTGSLVELMQRLKTTSRSNHLFHPPPKAFNRIKMVAGVLNDLL